MDSPSIRNNTQQLKRLRLHILHMFRSENGAVREQARSDMLDLWRLVSPTTNIQVVNSSKIYNLSRAVLKHIRAVEHDRAKILQLERRLDRMRM